MSGLAAQPIDFVIAWVDGADAHWQQTKAGYQGERADDGLCRWNDGAERYRDWGTLRYWFRAVEAYAPWVRRIHLVTCGQIPPWLNLAHPKLQLVEHRDYIPANYLPTFNSHCIETNLHRIPGLSEQFVYFNDDMFLTSPVSPTDFFRRGLPCGSAILAPVQLVQNGIRAEINDLYVINAHFDKGIAIAQNLAKWFAPCYGKEMVKTLLLLPFHRFPGFRVSHLPNAYLKHTFSQVWEAAAQVLAETCRHRFRTSTDVNQWLFEYWQYASGTFAARSPSIGAAFEGQAQLNAACEAIVHQRKPMICVNDAIDIVDFSAAKEKLAAAFTHILPRRSAFELPDAGKVDGI